MPPPPPTDWARMPTASVPAVAIWPPVTTVTVPPLPPEPEEAPRLKVSATLPPEEDPAAAPALPPPPPMDWATMPAEWSPVVLMRVEAGME